MGVAASVPRRRERRSTRPTIFTRLSALHGLVFLVAASFAARAAAAFAKATPDYFPDEYMYAELGRSLAESGRPFIRGADSSFPALLQPILTAPAWLLGDVADSYRLIQLGGALAMSLAAVPVFFLALRVGLGRATALVCAAVAVALPALTYASSILAEPFAYPLFLATVYTGTIALADRSRRAGLAFVILTGLVCFARVQFAVLPLCFLVAGLFLGLRRRSLTREARAHAVPVLLFAFPAGAVLASPHVVGIYGGFLDLELDPARLALRVATNAMGLMYASGWILIPGACLGFWLALSRPASDAEQAFAALSVSLAAALLLEAGLYGDIDRIQERYMFYAAPLFAIGFSLFARRGWPLRRAHALLATSALTLAALVPVSGYAASYGKVQSPFLLGVARLEEALPDPGTASLVVALVAAALSLAAIGASLRPQLGSGVVLALAVAVSAGTSTLATLFDARNAQAVREAYLPSERSWVDGSGLGDVALLAGFARHTESAAQLFWNRSVKTVLVPPGVTPPDSFAIRRARVGKDGALRAFGRVVRTPLLVDEWGSLVELRGAVPVASAPSYRLWRPAGTPRLALRFDGYFRDGWLAPRGELTVWPKRGAAKLAGFVSFEATAGSELGGAARLEISGPVSLEARIAVGHSRRVEVPVCGRGPWRATYEVDRVRFFDERFVSLRSTRPRFRPAARACR